jgi:propionyl-CoA synthetase
MHSLILGRSRIKLLQARRFFSSFSSGTKETSSNKDPRYHRSETVGPHGRYMEEYSQALEDPQAFWRRHAESLKWFKAPEKILEVDPTTNLSRWFIGGEINTCYNALDVHVADGRGEQVALIYDSPVTNNTKRRLTYKEMLDEVSAFAGVLAREMGVRKGDRVIIYMPMIPEALISMLACSRIGAVHSVVFGGFASKELATRINDCEPKLVITASCGVEPRGRIIHYKPLLDKALELSKHKVQKCIVFQREDVHRCELVPGRDFAYQELMSRDEIASSHDAIPLQSTDPHYILYTSGTT